jgi:4-aminobutyrate aminotransferase-like enzyme
MDAVRRAASGTFGGNPLSAQPRSPSLDVVTEPGSWPVRGGSGDPARTAREIARHPEIGEVRGLGSMIAFEFAERVPDRAMAVVDAAFERGLILLSCGLFGNVIRLLPPLNITPEELDEGLAILEESLGAA